jgi:hypothetical protein
VDQLIPRGSPSAPPQFNLKKGNNVLLWKTMRGLDVLQRRRSSKSELTIPKRASATDASLQGRLRAKNRMGGIRKGKKHRGAEETSASPSHKTKELLNCSKR